MNPCEVLMALQDISGTNDKVAFLKKHDTELLRTVIKNAVDKSIVFGIKQYDFHDEVAGHDNFDHDFAYVDHVITELARCGLSGNNAKKAIMMASKRLNEEQRYVFACILDKDLKCGVSAATANKAFKGLIPLWKMQKANPIKLKKVTYPCVAETKENGRGNTAIITGNTIQHFSNNGKENLNMSYFDEELLGISAGFPMVVYGEVRGRAGIGVDQFKSSQSLGAKDCDMSDMVFVIWDMLMFGEYKRRKCTRDQAQRSSRLKDQIRTYQLNHDLDEYKVQFVFQKKITSEDQLLAHYARQLKKGKEGVIVKSLDAVYEFKRSNNWMKLKSTEEEDLRIVAVKEGKGKLKKQLGSVTVKREKKKIDCPMGKGITEKIARKLWKQYKKNKDSLIGRIALITFQNVTPEGSLFLPKFCGVRNDKDISDDEEKKCKKKKRKSKSKKSKKLDKKKSRKKKSKRAA